MNLQAALADLANARFVMDAIRNELPTEIGAPEIENIMRSNKQLEREILEKLTAGMIDQLEETGHAYPDVQKIVHDYLGIIDHVASGDSTGKWLDHLGTIVGDIQTARSDYKKLREALAPAMCNTKVRVMFAAKRVHINALLKSLKGAYILALEAGGGARAKELYESVPLTPIAE